MLDTKQSWDDLVLRHAQDEETAYRILENRLYHNLTGGSCRVTTTSRWSGSTRSTPSGEYDLIVIDTPPTRNAIDFLEAPARMAEFFGGRLLRWLTMPYRVGGKRGAPRAQRREPALLPDGRPDPREQVPPGHRRVLPELPVDVRRVRRRARTRSSSCCTTAARRSRWSPRSRRAPLHEAERFCDGARSRATSTSARSC